MSDDYPLTQAEYTKILGITKEGLRSRRRSGKLEGQYTLKSNQYFYKRVRPNQHLTTPKKHTRIRRRGVHANGEETKYTSKALQQHNELKMLARLKYKLDDETLALLPEAINRCKVMKEERITEAARPATDTRQFKNYGTGIRNCKHSIPQYRPIHETKKEKQYKYY